ncbi:MAG: FGGY-family carbohydrate kinase [Synergistaceae bacterium]|jgi:xylulokinase|nr:FGGY-family carbohydrate kinase [Synergistaceae bacterium]
MASAYFIGADIGTSSAKAAVADVSGRIYGEAAEEYGLLTPEHAWAEQDADIYLGAAMRVIRAAFEKSGAEKKSVKGICISGLYGGSGVPLDEHMNPVRPCIIWMDRRAERECAEIARKISREDLFEITYNTSDPYFGFTKILWIKNNEPRSWAKTKIFLPPNDYVIYRLTGQTVIDHTSAGNLGGVYDMRARQWSQELMNLFGIPRGMMPERIVEPYETAGVLTEDAARLLGLEPGTPVCGGCIDCIASTLAAGALGNGQHTAIVSSSVNWAVIHDGRPANMDYISMPYVIKNMLYTYGGASTAGALLRWFRDELVPYVKKPAGPEPLTYKEMDGLAADIPPGSGGLVVLPYFMGERSPIWDAKARGAVVGLTLRHTNVNVYRAFLEASAYSLRHIMESSNIEMKPGVSTVLVGGASRSKLWRQIFADVTGTDILCPLKEAEAPLGDALIAAVGAGYLKSFDAVRDWVAFDEPARPDAEARRKYDEFYKVYKDLYISLKDKMHTLSEL